MGGLTTSAAFHSGTPAYPAQSRFWVSGNVTTTSEGILNGLFYTLGTFIAQADLEMYGSIFANNYNGTSLTQIHFDRAAAQTGEECPDEPPPEVCGGTFGASCTMDSDCCQPLYCLADGTCGYPGID